MSGFKIDLKEKRYHKIVVYLNEIDGDLRIGISPVLKIDTPMSETDGCVYYDANGFVSVNGEKVECEKAKGDETIAIFIDPIRQECFVLKNNSIIAKPVPLKSDSFYFCVAGVHCKVSIEDYYNWLGV